MMGLDLGKSLFLAASLALVVAAACGPSADRDPIDALAPDSQAYLMASGDSRVAFLGDHASSTEGWCDPSVAAQGYVLRRDRGDGSLRLDSIRPYNVDEHRISTIVETGSGYRLEGKTGADIAFHLTIEPTGDDVALVSWDGSYARPFRRCRLPV